MYTGQGSTLYKSSCKVDPKHVKRNPTPFAENFWSKYHVVKACKVTFPANRKDTSIFLEV
jgi:hypothetical protein